MFTISVGGAMHSYGSDFMNSMHQNLVGQMIYGGKTDFLRFYFENGDGHSSETSRRRARRHGIEGRGSVEFES